MLHVVTNIVLWMLPRATPCDLAHMMLAAPGTMWRPEMAVRASDACLVAPDLRNQGIFLVCNIIIHLQLYSHGSSDRNWV